ncbi:hypothetical protein [Roseiterribacter gracilis]|uniref:Uncharacterized protein n=1 Tax=Roseiterribacter gracilis TaxID=2812848 RepID=A0A8S8X8H1_9PROT|nr:hypothetical protein TMPK1_03580 [Rhodospirillales bacterium TMPK1]
MEKKSSIGLGWVEIVAGVAALWLVAAMAVVGSRIQTQVDEQRAIEVELADQGTARATPGFFAVARCMIRYGGWQLAEVGGAPALTLLVIAAASVTGRRRLRPVDRPEQS